MEGETTQLCHRIQKEKVAPTNVLAANDYELFKVPKAVSPACPRQGLISFVCGLTPAC